MVPRGHREGELSPLLGQSSELPHLTSPPSFPTHTHSPDVLAPNSRTRLPPAQEVKETRIQHPVSCLSSSRCHFSTRMPWTVSRAPFSFRPASEDPVGQTPAKMRPPSLPRPWGLPPRAWPDVSFSWQLYDRHGAVHGTRAGSGPPRSREFQAEQLFYYHLVIGVLQAWNYC